MADTDSEETDFDIYDYWTEFRRDQSVGRFGGDESDIWLVTKYADVELVLRDPKRFSSRVNADTMGPVMGTVILAMDGEEHRRYRNLVAHAFRPSALARWEGKLIAPTIHRLIDGLIGRNRADLVTEITSQFPVQVIAEVLGVPSEAHGRFHTWALDMNKGPEDYPVSIAASTAMRDYLTPIVEDRKAHPTDDLISDIVTAEMDGERLSDEHIYGFLRLLLPAGAETTFAAMGSCLFALLSRPDVLARVRAEPDLLDAVVEETLRWETSVTMVNRETTCPVEIDGVQVPEGVSLVCATGSANRDESRYTDPETWDLDRHGPAHIAFGTGRHQCLGMHLARMELRIGLGALLQRLEGLRFDDGAAATESEAEGKPPVRIEGLAFRSPPHLPVVFDSVRPGPGA
ncbi:MAG TPA: cytochrome P450 [Acidimicrobiales bacterium]|nr:cytochrome P450 [Acidimicrobiales bacterium]